jgi:hypothetical protein
MGYWNYLANFQETPKDAPEALPEPPVAHSEQAEFYGSFRDIRDRGNTSAQLRQAGKRRRGGGSAHLGARPEQGLFPSSKN